MALKVHGVSMATCTRRVALIAKERNVPYELVTVDFMKAEHKQPPHLQHQPFGQVPYIVVRRNSPDLLRVALSSFCAVSCQVPFTYLYLFFFFFLFFFLARGRL